MDKGPISSEYHIVEPSLSNGYPVIFKIIGPFTVALVGTATFIGAPFDRAVLIEDIPHITVNILILIASQFDTIHAKVDLIRRA